MRANDTLHPALTCRGEGLGRPRLGLSLSVHSLSAGRHTQRASPIGWAPSVSNAQICVKSHTTAFGCRTACALT